MFHRRYARYIMLAGWMLYSVHLGAVKEVAIANPLTWSRASLSALIGDTVHFSTPFWVCNNYGGIVIAPRRVYTPTHLVLPGSSDYTSVVQGNAVAMVDLTGVGSAHRLGEVIYDLTVRVNSVTSVKWISGTWHGNTRADLAEGYDVSAVDRRQAHTLLVACMNCEYYLTQDFGTGYGPDDAAAHARQRQKISAALAIINADIYGLVEVQQGQGALAEIAADLTRNTSRTYTYINDGSSVDGSYTKSGYVYCSDRVCPVGSLRSNDTKVRNHKKMQGFMDLESGESFVFSLNHFKAKSGKGFGADADQGDGQGSYNATRTAEAQSVLDQMAHCMTYFSDSDVLVMGDLNAYAMEDPIQLLISGGMTDLHRYFHADSSYSYVYRGQAGYLDHALCNGSMLGQITGITAYHINSDESDSYTYDKSTDLTMFRCSDHDPVLVGLKLSPPIDPNKRVHINAYQVYCQGATPCIINAQGGYYRIYLPSGIPVQEGEVYLTEQPIEGLGQGLYLIHIYGQGTCTETKLIVP